MTIIDANVFLDRLVRPEEPIRGTVPALSEPPQGVSASDLPDEWRERWEERAAIMEYDGKMPLERAEFLALEDILQQMKLAGAPLPRVGI